MRSPCCSRKYKPGEKTSFKKGWYTQALAQAIVYQPFYSVLKLLIVSLLFFNVAVLAARTASAAGAACGAIAPTGAFPLLFAMDHAVNQQTRNQHKDGNQSDIDQIGREPCQHFDFFFRYLAVSFCASLYGLNSCQPSKASRISATIRPTGFAAPAKRRPRCHTIRAIT